MSGRLEFVDKFQHKKVPKITPFVPNLNLSKIQEISQYTSLNHSKVQQSLAQDMSSIFNELKDELSSLRDSEVEDDIGDQELPEEIIK